MGLLLLSLSSLRELWPVCLRKGLFTVGALDNLDLNHCCEESGIFIKYLANTRINSLPRNFRTGVFV